MSYGLKIRTWRGVNVNDDAAAGFASDYEAYFLVADGETLGTPGADAVETARPRRAPLWAYSQPQGQRFAVRVTFAEGTAFTQAKLDALKEAWSPLETDEGFLVADDDAGEGSRRRRSCVVEKLVEGALDGDEPHFFDAMMYAPGLWEEDTLNAPAATNVTVSGQEVAVTNPGNAAAPFVLRLTANAVSATRQTKLRRVYVANRSLEALTHHANEGYPLDITGGGIDTTSGYRNDLADLRVLLHGDEIPRWVYPATANAATKVWCNLAFQPAKTATLAAAMTAGSNTFEVDSPEGFGGWPANGFLFVDSEPMRYVGASGFSAGTLTREFPTSHAAGAPVYWIEHAPEIIHDDSDAAAAPDWSDTEPVIDLSASSNTSHTRNGDYFNAGDLRSGALLRRPAASGRQDIRCYVDEDGKLRWEDLPAEAGKPPFSRATLDFPVPCTELELDYEVEQSLVLKVRGTDYGAEGGFVNDLLTAFWTDVELLSKRVTPAAAMKRMEFEARNAAVTGVIDTSLGVFTQSFAALSQQARVDNPFYESVYAEYTDMVQKVQDGVLSWPFGGVFLNPQDAGLTRYASQSIPMPAFIRFALEQETAVARVLMSTPPDTASLFYIYNSVGGQPGERIVWGIFSESDQPYNSGELVAHGRVVLAAGEYWLKPLVDFGVYAGRLSPDLWWGYHDVYHDRTKYKVFKFEYTADTRNQLGGSEQVLFVWDEYAEVEIPSLPRYHDDIFLNTPVFAVLSDETEPAANAPTETGMIATVHNLVATLDGDLAPLCYVAASVDALVGDLNLASAETGQELDALIVLPLTEALEIDMETGEATALETGFAAGALVAFSVPSERLELEPGSNTLTVTMAGVADVDVEVEFRGRYL